MVKCEEKYAARTVNESEDSKTANTVWNIFGASDEVVARAALGAIVPTNYTFPSGIVGFIDNITMKDISEGTTEDRLTHEATVNYTAKVPKIDDYIEYEFDTTGSEQITLTHALATTGVSGGGRAIPNFLGGINPKSDGSLAGLQTDESVFQFSLTKYWPRASITTGYQVLLSQLTKKINNAPFGPTGSTIPTGCCRFLGARGKPVGDKWPIDYRFEVRWPETITIGDMTVTKEGYQHISVYRVKFADSASKRVIEVPWAVYVQDVIPKVDLSALGVTW